MLLFFKCGGLFRCVCVCVCVRFGMIIEELRYFGAEKGSRSWGREKEGGRPAGKKGGVGGGV